MKTYKQFFCLLLALVMAFSLIPLSADAEDTIDSGNCGENLTWVLTTDGTLTISGTGEMADYVSDYPGWYKHRASLTKAVLEEGITSVSTCAFWDCQQLRWVQLPKTLTYIGSRAFERCYALELVEFAGPVPTTNSDSFKDVDAMAVCPAGNSTWGGDALGHLSDCDISLVNGEVPVSLELLSAPTLVNLALNESLDLRGIRLRARFADGSQAVLKCGVVRLDSCDTSALGAQTATVSYQGITTTFPVYVHASRSQIDLDPATLPESDHNYTDYLDNRQTISYPGADRITLTFSDETRLESYDRLYLYTRDGSEFASYTNWEASGLTVTVPGDTVELRLVSDEFGTTYGYKVVSAKADALAHIWEEVQNQAPGCEEYGWTAGSRCSICGYVNAGTIIPATGHSYEAWYKGEDRIWHRECANCGKEETSTADYIYTESGNASYGQLSLEELRELYNTVDWDMQAEYVSQPSSEPPYAVGRLTDACLDNLTAQVNFFRRIARLDPVVWDEELVELAQAGSVVTAANRTLSHYPERPEGMDDTIFDLGYIGCGTSNLALGRDLMQSVPAYMDDSDWSNIDRVGHRRWLLAPGLGKVGFGHTGGGAATHIMDAALRGSDGTDFVAWPGGNTVFPAEFMHPNMAWSVSYGKGFCTNQSHDTFRVVLTRESDGRQWEFSLDHADGYFNVSSNNMGYGMAIIFRPDGVEEYEGVYHVTISGIRPSSGRTETMIEYSVDFQKVKPHEHIYRAQGRKDPTCTEDGYTVYLCECGDSYNGDNVPAKGHSGGFAVCNSPAICDVCCEPYGEKIPYLHFGGTEIKDAVAAGEFTEGYTGDTYCLGCGILVIEGSVIPATHNHSYGDWKSDASDHWHECSCGFVADRAAHVPGPVATETAPQVCTVCGYELSPRLEAHTHTLTKVEAAEATHDAEGIAEHYTCACGKWFADEEAKEEIADHDSVIISVLPITYGDVNHDGRINVSDAVAVMKHRAGALSEKDIFCEHCANVDTNPKINVSDAVLIMKKRANKDMLFPIELQ